MLNASVVYTWYKFTTLLPESNDDTIMYASAGSTAIPVNLIGEVTENGDELSDQFAKSIVVTTPVGVILRIDSP